MRGLRYSKELNSIVQIPDALSAQIALYILCDELLGEDYCISDSISSEQSNVNIVNDILKKYKKR